MDEFDATGRRWGESGEGQITGSAGWPGACHRIEIGFEQEFAHALILIGRDHHPLARQRGRADRFNRLIESPAE